MIKISWVLTPQYSCVNAAAAICSGLRVADAKLPGLIGESAEVINDRLALADVETDQFWASLVAQGQKGKNERSRVELALVAAGCGELAADSIAPTIAGHLVDIRVAYTEAYPKLGEQLLLRAKPLQQQWEARGPGLMAAVERLTHKQLMPQKVTVVLVQPALGGGGGADPERQFAWIEAMLANPHDDVPEVLRLGWYLARLGLGRSEASRLVDANHLPRLATLALLPIMLQAGREMELIDDVSIARLFDVWNLRRAKNADAIEHLTKWWAQMEDGDTPFPVGIKALDRMLSN